MKNTHDLALIRFKEEQDAKRKEEDDAEYRYLLGRGLSEEEALKELNAACISCKARHSPLEASGECYDCAFSMRDPHPLQAEGVRLGSGVVTPWVKPNWPSNFQ